MGTPYLAELRVFSFNFAPKGWAMCNGQTLPINQNQALFAILGTTYGGDGQTTFALPDLQGRLPMHTGQGHTLGERAGQVNHTVIMSEMPAHIHPATAATAAASTATPQGNLWATETGNSYGSGSNTMAAMLPAAIGNAGGSQSHTNMQPYLTLNVCIALQGVFPSRN